MIFSSPPIERHVVFHPGCSAKRVLSIPGGTVIICPLKDVGSILVDGAPCSPEKILSSVPPRCRAWAVPERIYHDFTLMCNRSLGRRQREARSVSSMGSLVGQRIFPEPFYLPLESSPRDRIPLFVLGLACTSLFSRQASFFVCDLPLSFLSSIRESSLHSQFNLGITSCLDRFFSFTVHLHINSMRKLHGALPPAHTLLGKCSSLLPSTVFSLLLAFFPERVLFVLFFHVIAIFLILKKTVLFSLRSLMTLQRMFRGKHYNQAMGRSDNMSFRTEQIIVGALLFLVLLLFVVNVLLHYLFLLFVYSAYLLVLFALLFVENSLRDYTKYSDGLGLRKCSGIHIVEKRKVGMGKILFFALRVSARKTLLQMHT
jgi:N-acetylglucosaminyl transferase component (Gpi1)